MKLAKKICDEHGFARFRYQEGWCHMPNPDAPYEVAEHANNMALYDQLLPKRQPRAQLYGSFRRTHLATTLLLAKLEKNEFENTGYMTFYGSFFWYFACIFFIISDQIMTKLVTNSDQIVTK